MNVAIKRVLRFFVQLAFRQVVVLENESVFARRIRDEVLRCGYDPQCFIPAVFPDNARFRGFLFGVGRCRVLGVCKSVLNAKDKCLGQVVEHELLHYGKRHIWLSMLARMVFFVAVRVEQFALELLVKYEREAHVR